MLLKDDPSRGYMPYPAVKVSSARSGPLKGLTLAVKDLFDVVGYPTSAGSPHMLALSGVKKKSAFVVQKLLDAGAEFTGKTITDELAFSLNGKNAHFGTPLNGGAKDRIPGGSSSGSASAVSNNLCDIALGTDTGGSVRGPASHCGLYGLRPTHGRVSLRGAHDLAKSFDTCGWFARDAATYGRVADVLLGKDRKTLSAKPRLLLAQDCFDLLEEPVKKALAPAIKRLEKLYGKAQPIVTAPRGFDELYWAFRQLQGREAWETDGAMITKYQPPLGTGVADRFAYARGVTNVQVAASSIVRENFTSALATLLGKDSILILPTMADIAPKLTDSEADLESYRNRSLNMLCLSGLSKMPQLSMPLAKRLGAPLGLSIMGPSGTDRSLVRIAEELEQVANNE
jgi:amidase